MPYFSEVSLKKLSTCHPDLQRLFTEVIKEKDCIVICGHRGQEAQDRAFRTGFSKTPWPRSKHNSEPSLAVDVCPYPLDWNDKKQFQELADLVLKKALELNIQIRWGGHFKSLVDMPHYELVDQDQAS